MSSKLPSCLTLRPRRFATKRKLVTGLLTAALLYADEYENRFHQAAAYNQQGNYEQAILEYKAALRIRPGALEALNNLAVMYYAAQRYAEAFATASRIWESHDELQSAALITGLAAVQCNRPRDAIAPLRKVLSSDPVNRDALLGLASAYYALNELPEAIEVYKRDVAHSPNDANAWYGLAVCYERTAENASKRLSQMPGGAGYSKRLLAQYLQSAGNSKLAAEAFGEAKVNSIASSPETEKQYQLARDLADQSRNAFEQFIHLAPDSWQALVFLGDVDRQHGNLPSALAHYQKAAEGQPKNPAPLLGLGTVYWELGDFDRAISYLHETLQLNPQSNQAVFELANIAVRRHLYAEAVPLLRQYLSAQPDALAARADLGRAYSHLGQYENAVIELTKAVEADEEGDIHYQLSVALRKLGRVQQADAALKKSTEIRESRLKREQRLHAAP